MNKDQKEEEEEEEEEDEEEEDLDDYIKNLENHWLFYNKGLSHSGMVIPTKLVHL